MGLNKKAMMMKVACVVLFLVAFSATVEARFDPNTFLAQMFKENGEPNYFIKSTTTACCNSCLCNKKNPPDCYCKDIGETCHSACKYCICTLSIPPQCQCTDRTHFCYPPCSSSAKPQIAAN